MNTLKKLCLMSVIAAGLMLSLNPSALAADNPDPPHRGSITGKTVLGGALSLLIWPGIGQAINDNKGEKVATHAIVGLLPPFRFWSCYDALVDRSGGYWKGRI